MKPCLPEHLLLTEELKNTDAWVPPPENLISYVSVAAQALGLVKAPQVILVCSPRLRIIALNEDTTWIIKVWSTEQQARVTWELVRNTQPHHRPPESEPTFSPPSLEIPMHLIAKYQLKKLQHLPRMRAAVICICKGKKKGLTLGVSVQTPLTYFLNTQRIQSHLTPVRDVENLF